MDKFYVECGGRQLVILAADAEHAAIRSVEKWWDQAEGIFLGQGIRVSQVGFSRPDARKFVTFDIVAKSFGTTAEELVDEMIRRI